MKQYIDSLRIQEILKYDQLTRGTGLSIVHRLLVKKRISRAFSIRCSGSPSFPVEIDLSVSVEEMIKQGDYDRTSVDAFRIARDFLVDLSGPTRYSKNLKLMPPPQERLTISEWIADLFSQGWKPERIPELLAFGKRWPMFQRKFHILALGEMDPYSLGSVRIAALTGHVGIRRIELLHDRGSSNWTHLDLALVSRI